MVNRGVVRTGEDAVSDAVHAANDNADGTGDVTVTNTGTLVSGGGDGISALNRGAGAIAVTNSGRIEAGSHGIRASHRAAGAVSVTVAEGGVVTAVADGVRVERGDETGTQTVTVRGRVAGGDGEDGEWSGIRMDGGGTVVIGPRARVEAKSGVLVRPADAAGAMTVTLEKGPHGLAGHFLGRVLNTETTSFTTRTGAEGTAETLSVGDTVDMRGETKGVFDAVRRARLGTVEGGHAFTEVPGTETRAYHDRARVHEALPSVLLDLLRPPSPAGRAVSPRGGAVTRQAPAGMAAARGGGHVRARIDAGGGKRRTAGSTTGSGHRGLALSWDTEHWGVEAGLDLPVDEWLTLGLGLRHLRGRATVHGGGRIDVSALGLGLSATRTAANGLYIDGWLSHTRFGDIDLSSNARGALVSGLSGTGTAAGVRAGRRVDLGGLALTPRGGLAWSSASVAAFDDVAAAGGGRVAMGRAESLAGGLGVLAEFGGAEGASGRAFASLDLDAAGTVRLSARVFHATAGDGNTAHGGSVALNLRF